MDYAATNATEEDLLEAIGLIGHSAHRAAGLLSCLEALALFDVNEAGTYFVERLVARSWPHRRPIA